MTEQLRNIIKKIERGRKHTQKGMLFKNILWTAIDTDLDIQRMIFKDNGELIVTKDGNASTGTWEYFPDSFTFLINQNDTSELYVEVYLDESVLVLKKDSSASSFLLFSNPINIEHNDILGYLEAKFRSLNNVVVYTLPNGGVLEIVNSNGSIYRDAGRIVTLNGEKLEDGFYIINKSTKLLIKESRIVDVYELAKVGEYKGKVFEVLRPKYSYDQLANGSKVYINGSAASNGNHQLSPSTTIEVKDGKIVSVTKKSLFERLFG